MNPKSSYLKIAALLLSSFILFSSFGLTIDMHMCQGNIKSVSLIGKAKKCVEMKENNVCKSANDDVSFSKKKCCSNASFKAEISSQNLPVISEQVENLVLDLNPFVKLVCGVIFETENDIVRYYPPPDKHTGRDLLVFHQTFLI